MDYRSELMVRPRSRFRLADRDPAFTGKVAKKSDARKETRSSWNG